MFTKFFKELKRGYEVGKAIKSVAKKRGNQMAAISMLWGCVFNEGLKYNWGIRFVSKEIMSGDDKNVEVKLNAPNAIFATVPKIDCVLVCLENLEEATKDLNDTEWACYVIEGICHEYRHALQIEYFESVGIDANNALQYLAFSYLYLTSPIEKDAISFSRTLSIGYHNGCPKIESNWIPVSEAMKDVVKEIERNKIFDYKKA